MSTGDDDRGGFGGKPWQTGIRPEPPRPSEPARPAGGPRRAPFGGATWDQSFESGAAEPEAEEESGEAPRRRRNAPEMPQFPRKTVAALGAKAKVVRDQAGVPHVTARSERDAYAALGVCMAEDRLWQLDVMRRLACGRLAEVLGSPFARHDALVRTIGIPRRAAAAANRLEGVARDVLAAFIAGINVVRAEAKPAECGLLGYEIEPWTVADSLAVELYAAWSLSLETWPYKLLVARALAAAGLERSRWIAPPGLDLSFVPEPTLALWRRLDMRVLDHVLGLPGVGAPVSGSNGWAAGRARSGTGSAIVAGDPHLAATLPSVMYLAHLEAPGFSVAGAAHVGGPILHLGRNRHCAWGVTNFSLDDVDCVIEELDGIGNFRTADGWAPLSRRTELVRIRGEENLKLEVAETRSGPLLSHLVAQIDGSHAELGLLALAVRWGVNSLGSALSGWLAVARAASLDEIQAATTLLDKGPLALNLYAGDDTGEVGHFGVGSLPVRGAAARLPVRGWNGEGKWTSVIGLSTLASNRGVDSVVTANEVHVATHDGRYPAHAYADHAYRARRIRQVLGDATRVDIDLCRELQRDVTDLAAVDLLPYVRRALEHPDARQAEVLAEVAPRLVAWDGTASADSPAAAVFYLAMFRDVLRELFPEARFGPLARHWRFAWWGAARILTSSSSPWFADESEKEGMLARALVRAATTLAEHLGPDPGTWSWGAIHPFAARHPLGAHEDFAGGAPEPWPAPGSPFTVLQQRFDRPELPFSVVLAPCVRMIADLATDAVHLALPSGESGQVQSPHLLDQLEAWRRGESLTIRLGADVTGETVELIPG